MNARVSFAAISLLAFLQMPLTASDPFGLLSRAIRGGAPCDGCCDSNCSDLAL
jgi:hypothetical protein